MNNALAAVGKNIKNAAEHEKRGESRSNLQILFNDGIKRDIKGTATFFLGTNTLAA